MKLGIDLGSHTAKAAFLATTGQPVLVADTQLKDPDSVASVYLPVGTGMLIGELAWHFADTRPTHVEVARYDPGTLAPNRADAGGSDPGWLPETLTGLFLKKLKADAEILTGGHVTGVVLTVPPHLTGDQQNALRIAAQLADLHVLDLIPEPEAIALHYRPVAQKPLVVLSWGSHRLSVSVLEQQNNRFVQRASRTAFGLGGAAWTMALAEHITRRYEPVAPDTLMRLVEPLKVGLSSAQVAKRTVLLNNTLMDVLISRTELERAIRPQLAEANRTVLACLNEAGLRPDEIGALLLSGGSTLVPFVRQWAGRLFGPDCVCYDRDRLEAAVFGAAHYAASINRPVAPPERSGLTEHNIGVRIIDPATRQPTVDTVIRQHVLLPARGKRVYYPASKEQQFINLDVVQYKGGNPADYTRVGMLKIGPLPARQQNYAVEVTFSCADDGTLSLTACERNEGGPYDGPSEPRTELAQQFQAEGAAAFPLARQRQLVRTTVVNGIY